jgi:hypothetical protein
MPRAAINCPRSPPLTLFFSLVEVPSSPTNFSSRTYRRRRLILPIPAQTRCTEPSSLPYSSSLDPTRLLMYSVCPISQEIELFNARPKHTSAIPSSSRPPPPSLDAIDVGVHAVEFFLTFCMPSNHPPASGAPETSPEHTTCTPSLAIARRNPSR